MPPKTMTCVDCPSTFEFSERDQQFYKSKGFDDPKRCPDCRAEKKRRMNEAGKGREGGR